MDCHRSINGLRQCRVTPLMLVSAGFLAGIENHTKFFFE